MVNRFGCEFSWYRADTDLQSVSVFSQCRSYTPKPLTHFRLETRKQIPDSNTLNILSIEHA